MLGIFDDDRRRTGALARGPGGVGRKSVLTASKMLESGPHLLALLSWSDPILIANADQR